MRTYHCDICGEPFDPKASGCNLADRPVPVPGVFGVACSGEDVCPQCMRIGSGVDFNRVLIDAWRKAVEAEVLNG